MGLTQGSFKASLCPFPRSLCPPPPGDVRGGQRQSLREPAPQPCDSPEVALTQGRGCAGSGEPGRADEAGAQGW